MDDAGLFIKPNRKKNNCETLLDLEPFNGMWQLSENGRPRGRVGNGGSVGRCLQRIAIQLPCSFQNLALSSRGGSTNFGAIDELF
ncbi:hypothetical protein WN943_025764 [Citrus x changshan-huyou]